MYPALNQSHRRVTIRLKSLNAKFLGHPPNRGVTEEVFAEVVERFSDYKVSKNRIELMLPIGHPDLDAVIEFSKLMGLVIEPSSKEQSQVEILDYTKHTATDVAVSRYVECGLFEPTFEGSIESDGDLGIGLEKMGSAESLEQEFGSIPNLPHLIIVRGEAKRHIEKSGLIGFDLMTIPFKLDGGECQNDQEPLFLIWSSVVLPNVNNEISVTSLGCRLIDEYEVRPQLRYSKTLPEVDVALSHELFGPSECYRRIIYSQKAKSVLEELGMNLDYVPVRIEASLGSATVF